MPTNTDVSTRCLTACISISQLHRVCVKVTGMLIAITSKHDLKSNYMVPVDYTHVFLIFVSPGQVSEERAHRPGRWQHEDALPGVQPWRHPQGRGVADHEPETGPVQEHGLGRGGSTAHCTTFHSLGLIFFVILRLFKKMNSKCDSTAHCDCSIIFDRLCEKEYNFSTHWLKLLIKVFSKTTANIINWIYLL